MTRAEIQQELDKVVEFLNPYYQESLNTTDTIKTKQQFYDTLLWYLDNNNIQSLMSGFDVDDERHELKYKLIKCGFDKKDISDMLDIYSYHIEYQLEFLKLLADLALNKQYYKIKKYLTI